VEADGSAQAALFFTCRKVVAQKKCAEMPEVTLSRYISSLHAGDIKIKYQQII